MVDRKQEWKMAKWIRRHGPTKRKDLPKWFDPDLLNPQKYFRIQCRLNDNGYPENSPEDLFEMTGEKLDAYQDERQKRIHHFRDWIIPCTSIVSILLSIAALAISIISLLLRQQ